MTAGRARVLLLGGRSVPDSALLPACRRLGIGPVHGEWRHDGTPALLVSADGNAELDLAFRPPLSGYVEWQPGRPVGVSAACVEAIACGGLAMSMTSRRAYETPVAAIFTAALARRLELPEELAGHIEMALHEAVANALVHGNLEVSSEPRGDAAGFAAYCDTICRRLGDPGMAQRRIEVTARPLSGGVEVMVADEGAGFDIAGVLARDPLREDKWGRGLRIIADLARRVEAKESGRRLVMTFA